MRKLINMKSTTVVTAVLAGILSGLVSQPALAESRKGLYQAFYAGQNVTTAERVSVLTRRNVKSTVVIGESSVIVKLRPDGLLLFVH